MVASILRTVARRRSIMAVCRIPRIPNNGFRTCQQRCLTDEERGMEVDRGGGISMRETEKTDDLMNPIPYN